MAERNNFDPDIDLDNLFENNFKTMKEEEELEEEAVVWNMYLIHNHNMCFQKGLACNQEHSEIVYSKLVKTDDAATHLFLATTPLKEPETFNVVFEKSDSWKITEKPNVFDHSSSHSLFSVQVPFPHFKCDDLVKASFKLVGDKGLEMTCSKSILYEKEGSNLARYIYGRSLENEKLQINSINEIELLKDIFLFSISKQIRRVKF